MVAGAVRHLLLEMDLDLASKNVGTVLPRKDSFKLDARLTAALIGNLGLMMGDVDRFGDANFAAGSSVNTFGNAVVESQNVRSL